MSENFNYKEYIKLPDCNLIHGKNNNGVYKCDNYYIKIRLRDSDCKHEYELYKKIEQSPANELFIESPMLYTDHEGCALVFKNDHDTESLINIYKKDETLFYTLLPKAIDLIADLHNIYRISHGDAHLGNIIYNYKTKKLKFIDLENLSFNSLLKFSKSELTSYESFMEEN